MRAKDEFKFIAEAYDTKLILERVVDGKLMCPEACCGAPVVECTCGPDCPHCNCFMIHKAMKSKGFTNKLLKEFYKMRDPEGDGSWPDDDDDRSEDPNYGEPKEDDEYDQERKDNIDYAKRLDPKRSPELHSLQAQEPRDSMYIKDPEELKKALAWHHGNYSKLRNKSMRGELTDEEYDSLKHSEGELDLHDQLQR